MTGGATETLERRRVCYPVAVHYPECVMRPDTTLLEASPDHGRSGTPEQTLPTLKMRQPFGAVPTESDRSGTDFNRVSDESNEPLLLAQPAAGAAVWPEAAAQGNHAVGGVRPRSQRRFACKLLMNAWEEELAGLCETIDISAVGMRVRRIGGTRRRLRSNEVVLEFQLPDSKELFRIPAVRERADDGRTFFARFVGSPERIRALTDRLTSALSKLADGPQAGARQVMAPTHRTPSQRSGR